MAEYVLGIELGSTRIKSVLTDCKAQVIASGSFEWESTLVNGLWSYSLEDVKKGLQASYASLASAFKEKTGTTLTELKAMGISAMMHGYLAFDADGTLLTPFRTWQNTNTEVASEELCELFNFNVPLRWSVSHYYQAVLDCEAHVKNVATVNTLAGYVHYLLTGKRVLGVGDASGMFPIKNGDYDADMMKKFNARLAEKGFDVDFEEMLPTVLIAGQNAGYLTNEGALLLDPTGALKGGCPLCPPEGDAGTGMVATNCIAPKTANVSAGTSAFLMAVLEKDLSKCYREIDMVTTPGGDPVAMVHINNFTSEMNAWADLFGEVIALGGGKIERGKLFDALYAKALEGDAAAGGLVGYNFLAGEPMVGVKSGVPLTARFPDADLTLASFMKMQIYSALASLAIGMDTLYKENVRLENVCGHGGFFKAPVVGQSAMSAALGAPVTVLENSGEGGAWGVALLALYRIEGGSFVKFLDGIFANAKRSTLSASEELKADFNEFLNRYKAFLAVEKKASEVAECLKN